MVTRTLPYKVNVTGTLSGGPLQLLGSVVQEKDSCANNDGFCQKANEVFQRYFLLIFYCSIKCLKTDLHHTLQASQWMNDPVKLALSPLTKLLLVTTER